MKLMNSNYALKPVGIVLLLLFSLHSLALDLDMNTHFANKKLLDSFFGKLHQLEKTEQGKINIVHIGDSHIQADFFTGEIRQSLQRQFGNAGLGFVFPYRLAKTNGTRKMKYTSNITWETKTNVSSVLGQLDLGLSGIALRTSSDNFIIQLQVEDYEYRFNTIKAIFSTQKQQFRFSNSPVILDYLNKSVVQPSTAKKHKVKKGETLSLLSRKYGVTVAEIQKANNMKNVSLQIDKMLNIPTKAVKQPQTKQISVKDKVNYLPTNRQEYSITYTSSNPLSEMLIMPNEDVSSYSLNGIVLEKNEPGILYHAIGVNGAKFSDYNKYPLFFNQLPILNPDLIIVSLGTNESFGRLSTSEYISQLKSFVENIRNAKIDAPVLIMTPPPSLFRKSRPNTFVSDYSIALMQLTGFPVWDMFTRMDGLAGIRPKGKYASLTAKDKVHYSENGYIVQGEMFFADLMQIYNEYKNLKNN